MPSPTAETIAAIEHLLIDSLELTEERKGSSGSRNGKSYSDPRICDIAGLILSSHSAGKYVFDLEAPLAQRDRERIAAINVWRKAHEQVLLAVPEKPRVEALPREKVKP